MPPKGSTTQPHKGKQSKSGASSSSHNGSASKQGPSWVVPKAITHPEHHHTLNHLNQVAAFYAILSASLSSPLSSETAGRLQGEMIRSATTLSRKAVIRLDTGIKRAACRKCDTVWMEGLTVQVRSRVNGPHDHVVKWRCGVCGLVARRPAPDLLPKLPEEEKKRSEDDPKQTEEVVGEGGIKRQREGSEVDLQPEKKEKVSQRQRRRTASIKRQLLLESDPDHRNVGPVADDQLPTMAPSASKLSTESSSTITSAASSADALEAPKQPVKMKLSRSQQRRQRTEKLARRAASSSTNASQTRGRRKILGLRPHERNPVLFWDDSPTPSIDHSPISHPHHQSMPVTSHEKAKPTSRSGLPSQSKGRDPRPSLPHFNDRVEASHWDNTLTTLHNDLNATIAESSKQATPTADDTERNQAYATQALKYWEQAARSRGDHLLVSGVGKNGALGPTLP